MTLSIRLLTTLILAIVISGCNSFSTHEKASYSKGINTQYPPITVRYGKPSEAIENECRDYNTENTVWNCGHHVFSLNHYWNSLKSTQLFKAVDYDVNRNDYQVFITTTRFMNPGAGEFSNAIISGLSLFTVPTASESRVVTDVDVTWRGLPVASYTYDKQFYDTLSIYDDMNASQLDFIESVLSLFIQDAQRDNFFTSEGLYEALSASDYARDLDLPEDLSQFIAVSTHLYPDPFLGLVRGYKSNSDDGVYRVQVYPIKRTILDNPDFILEQETKKMLKDFELRLREKGVQSLEIIPPKSISYSSGETIYSGYYISDPFVDGIVGDVTIDTYLFIQHDKFIKIQVGCLPKEECLSGKVFYKKVIENIKVPEESLFMSKLRQRKRENL